MAERISEEFSYAKNTISRRVTVGAFVGETAIRGLPVNDAQAVSSVWWQAYLRGSVPEQVTPTNAKLRIVDLFCGCGGLVLGVKEAIGSVSCKTEIAVAVDTDEEVLRIYSSNLNPKTIFQGNVNALVDYHVVGRGKEASFSYRPETMTPTLARVIGNTDILVAGPPCQGHSNLNNYTRREDPRNLLYLGAVASAVAVEAKAVIIENVPEVLNDRQQVVETARQLLSNHEYHCSDYILNAGEHGCAQLRRRHFLVATKQPPLPLDEASRALKKEGMTVEWAINDLLNKKGVGNFETSPNLSRENKNRIDYLFENREYDLPNEVRPDCHKNGNTYPSVYGRLKWDMPSGTVTTGFQTPGRGRYIHPLQRRVLTPHEAARLQGFPDSFHFVTTDVPNPSRNLLTKCIGDAVPPVLGYVAALCALTGL